MIDPSLNDGSEPDGSYVCQDPDLKRDPPRATMDIPSQLTQFCRDYAMTYETFAELAKVDLKSINNWLSYRHSISSKLGQRIEMFMADYSKTHSKQSNIFEFVS